ILQLVVDRIVVEDDRIVVHHVVPTGPVRLQTGQQRTEKVKVRGGDESLFSVSASPRSVAVYPEALRRDRRRRSAGPRPQGHTLGQPSSRSSRTQILGPENTPFSGLRICATV